MWILYKSKTGPGLLLAYGLLAAQSSDTSITKNIGKKFYQLSQLTDASYYIYDISYDQLSLGFRQNEALKSASAGSTALCALQLREIA